ncbi:MAG: DUF58 domain-containing protein [Gammaproteobacteria bacterium]|nr:DUF58 domain-containing protein [Gammaproteobacteria bacterium]MDH3768219.1 DUF58 domain-containing protein [Gammaproteobacteria bacterium]
MASSLASTAEAVGVTVGQLVGLNRAATALTLSSKNVRAQIAGDYLSPFKGRGMEFDESRPYQAGDEARNLHWRVMARTGRPFTKLFREEREQPVFLWLDLRQRMHFATRGVYKSVQAARAATLIAWAASRRGDRVGGVVFSETHHHELKPARGKSGVLQFINRVVSHPAWINKESIAPDPRAARDALIRLRRIVRPGSLVFLLSDFGGFDAVAEGHLAQLARHNEITQLFVYDPFERRLPPPGAYRLSDGHDEFLLDTTDARYRDGYTHRFDERVDYLRSLARRHRIAFLDCSTDEDPAQTLQKSLLVRS